MTYESSATGRVGREGFRPGRDLSDSGFWTFEAVQERLVEAMHLWDRSPGGGRWPFAGDGPWQLITRRVRAAAGGLALMDLWRLEQDERRLGGGERPLPLTRSDIARRDEASEWLGFVPEADREIVVLALGCLARGAKHVPWLRLKHRLGIKFGADGLRKRYSRAITDIAEQLNRAENCDGGLSTHQFAPPFK